MDYSASASLEERIEYYRGMVRRYIGALNGGDLEAILACFAEDAEFQDPPGKEGRTFKGKAQLRAFYTQVVKRGTRLEITGPIRGSHIPTVATPLKAITPGFETDVITTTTFNDKGLVCHYVAYWGPTDTHPAPAR